MARHHRRRGVGSGRSATACGVGLVVWLLGVEALARGEERSGPEAGVLVASWDGATDLLVGGFFMQQISQNCLVFSNTRAGVFLGTTIGRPCSSIGGTEV